MKHTKNINKDFNNSTKVLIENDIWSQEDIDAVKSYITVESAKQSPERKLRNELLGIKYQMQDYIKNDEIDKEMSIIDFVKLYLKSLKLTQRDLASAFEMKDTNLYKYLKGDRKLNTDIVFKLSAFSHTQPELWYYIQTKNELRQIVKEKDNLKKYEKYDYENILELEK
jgi:plasmid maintenance system antidote protein VapI